MCLRPPNSPEAPGLDVKNHDPSGLKTTLSQGIRSPPGGPSRLFLLHKGAAITHEPCRAPSSHAEAQGCATLSSVSREVSQPRGAGAHLEPTNL